MLSWPNVSQLKLSMTTRKRRSCDRGKTTHDDDEHSTMGVPGAVVGCSGRGCSGRGENGVEGVWGGGWRGAKVTAVEPMLAVCHIASVW